MISILQSSAQRYFFQARERVSKLYNFYRYGIFGVRIRIDASSVCQLKCHLCPQNTGGLKSIGRGYLKFDHFKKFVQNHPGFSIIELSNWGELFLNPELHKIIEYAHQKKIWLTANNGANLNHLTEEVAESLVKYKFGSIVVSLDGASSEVYSVYRQGGKISNVLDNVKRINKYKDKYRSEFPKMTWQFIAFGHNESDVAEAKRLAKSLDMDFSIKLNSAESYSPIKDKKLIENLVGISSRSDYKNKHKKLYIRPCHQFWTEPQIHHDGSFLGCCYNVSHKLGNIFDKPLSSITKNKAYQKIIKVVTNQTSDASGTPCENCKIYHEMRKLGYFYDPGSPLSFIKHFFPKRQKH